LFLNHMALGERGNPGEKKPEGPYRGGGVAEMGSVAINYSEIKVWPLYEKGRARPMGEEKGRGEAGQIFRGARTLRHRICLPNAES